MPKVRPMKHKNSDLGMWHGFRVMADHLQFVAQTEEQKLYSTCESYHYDDSAYEEECSQEKIMRKKDFDASEECWKCKFYKPKTEIVAVLNWSGTCGSCGQYVSPTWEKHESDKCPFCKKPLGDKQK